MLNGRLSPKSQWTSLFLTAHEAHEILVKAMDGHEEALLIEQSIRSILAAYVIDFFFEILSD